MGILIKTNEKAVNISPKNGEFFNIKELEEILESPVSFIVFSKGFVLVTNPCAKDINFKATQFIKDSQNELYKNIVVFGTAFLIGTDEIDLK